MDSKVLLVDEEEQFLKTLARRLELSGFAVKTATASQEAFGFLQGHPVHVVVLGVSEEGEDFLELLREIKTAKPAAEVIMLTNESSVDFSMRAMKLGAYDCLQKPTDTTKLVEQITEVVRLKRARAASLSKE
jgi:DNA-binding NtrC family response regulator